MATVEYTASLASGYMTDAQYIVMGNKRVLAAHFCAPSTNSGYIRTGMPVVDMAGVTQTDIDAMYFATATVGMGVNVHFSGHAQWDTGTIFIIGD
jgi:hypothetical protein